MTLIQEIESLFRDSFDSLGIAKIKPIVLQEASKPEFGDYQVNGVMSIAKDLKKNPRDLAFQIIQNLPDNHIIENLEVAGPGFINLSVNNQYLANKISGDILRVKNEPPQKIVVDYSSPNLAKEMHVGHLRSTIIGDALVRIYLYMGNEVIRRNHVGDWGTQFGMLTAYLFECKTNNLEMELSDLESFYRKAKVRFDEDAQFANLARDYVVRLQSGDKEILDLWKKFVDISLGHCQSIYDLLNTTLTPQDVVGESFYNNLLKLIVDKLINSGMAIDSEGAKCVFLGEDETGSKEDTPFIIQKKDGGYLYATTDIAAVYDRVERLHADRLVYVIDSRQSLHMKQLFAVTRKAKIASDDIIMEHAAFGTMMGEDGKPFKTRSGDTVKLIDLISEAKTRAYKLVNLRNTEWDNFAKEELANKLAIASIKYADLSKNRLSDYVFSFDKMLSFEGNTAPYLLYAYTRVISIFKKAGINPECTNIYNLDFSEFAEHQLALHIAKFPDKLISVAKENYPHYLTSYVYELCGLFMKFYELCPILRDDVQIPVRNSRLRLAYLTAQTIKTTLDLLGIEVVDKM